MTGELIRFSCPGLGDKCREAMESLRIFSWRSSKYLPLCPERVTSAYVSGQEQNLGVDRVPTLGRLDPTSNSYAGIHILLLGLELTGFGRKSRHLRPVSLAPLLGYTCGDLLGWCWAEGCRRASDCGQRAQTAEWVAVVQSLSLDIFKTQLDEQPSLNPGPTLL